MEAQAASSPAESVGLASVGGLRSAIIGPGFIGEVHARAARAAGGVVAAKDMELIPVKRKRYGWPGISVARPDPWDVGWWRYRVPGLGQVDWTRVIDTLYEGGFDSVLSVVHEDPVWGGTEDRIQTGLRVAHRTYTHSSFPEEMP